MRSTWKLAVVSMACGLSNLGCERSEPIRTYRTPKELKHVGAEQNRPAMTRGVDRAQGPLSWNLPEGWQEESRDGAMRVATLRDSRQTPELVVAVTRLSGAAGGLLANINRWRGQIDLPPVDEDALATMTRPLEGGTLSGLVVDMAGPTNITEQTAPQRMIVGMFDASGETWFFKAVGPTSQIDAAQSDLLSLFRSVRVKTPVTDNHDEMAHPSDTQTRLLRYVLPMGWREDLTPRVARVATFTIEDDSETELAITRFPGDVGGEFANVNRWRAQLGLPPVVSTNSEDAADVTIDGHPGRLYRLNGPDQPSRSLSMLVAFVQYSDHTWFFKMTGPKDSIDKQRSMFEQFLESVQFTQSDKAPH